MLRGYFDIPLTDALLSGSVKSYAQNCFRCLAEIYYRGASAPLVAFRRSGREGYGSRYALEAMIEDIGFPVYNIPVSESRLSSGDLLTMQGTGPNLYTSLYTDVPFADGAWRPIVRNRQF